MKKTLSILCACVLTLVCLYVGAISVNAADARTGKCGDNLQYSLDTNGVMTISGTGNMWDFRSDAFYYFDLHEHPWESLKPEIKSVVFKPGITYIGAAAFSGCENLTRVTFTDTITTIGCYAFMECRNLGNFTLPKNLQGIWHNAFQNCDKITKVVIPDSVSCLTADIFGYCDALADVYIGGSQNVTAYEYWESMFNGCLALEEIKVSPDNRALTAVDGVLYNKELKTLLQYPAGKKDKTYTIQATTETIGAFAVEGNPYVEKLVLPSSIKAIANRAMSDCVKLKSINIPNGVLTIETNTFYNCKSLTTVKIPDSVITIGDGAFGFCSGLSSITIPDSVMYIGEYAFSSCSNLTSVNIPESVTLIGERPFGGCDSLTGIWVNAENPNYSSDSNGVLFDKKKTKVLQAPATISGSYAIPNSVTAVGNYAFNNCDSLTAVTIPDSVITIGINAFDNCDNLTDLAIGSNVTTIGDWAFAYCYSLPTVTIPDSVTTIGNVAFCCCYKLTSVTVGSGVTAIGDSAFMSCIALTDVFYSGSKTKWNEIKLGANNEPLLQAKIYFTKRHTHSYKTTVQRATFKENGEVIRKCAICGKVESTKTILRIETIKLYKTAYVYNGKARTPTVIVKDSAGKTLKKDTDYTVTYGSGRKNVGTYKVTVKMKGNYSGTKTLPFQINPTKVTSKFTFKLYSTSYTYNGKAKTPTVTVKDATGKTLKKNTDYTVSYAKGRKNVGTYKVTIKMKGNYTGTKTLTFKIVPKAASINKLTAKSKAIAVKLNRVTSQSTGYEIQYSTRKNFSGSKTKVIKSYKTSSVILTGLKAKTTYYIRIRTYKTVDGVKYYSNWCTYKSIKTK